MFSVFIFELLQDGAKIADKVVRFIKILCMNMVKRRVRSGGDSRNLWLIHSHIRRLKQIGNGQESETRHTLF